jgi:hypothetical protein
VEEALTVTGFMLLVVGLAVEKEVEPNPKGFLHALDFAMDAVGILGLLAASIARGDRYRAESLRRLRELDFEYGIGSDLWVLHCADPAGHSAGDKPDARRGRTWLGHRIPDPTNPRAAEAAMISP